MGLCKHTTVQLWQPPPLGTGLTLITPRTDPLLSLSTDRNIAAICRLVIIGGHGSLMTSWWRHLGPRVTDTRCQDICIFILETQEESKQWRVHSTSISSVSPSQSNLIDHKTNPCRCVCFLMFHITEDVGWHPGTRRAHLLTHRPREAKTGRGTGDNVICISQTRGIFSDLFVIEGGGPGYGNRLTREKRLVHFNSCCWWDEGLIKRNFFRAFN